MFLKNEKGEIVNLNKVVAIKTYKNVPNDHGELAPCICLHTENGHKVHFWCDSQVEFVNQYKSIQEMLILGPKNNQMPWNHVHWGYANGDMFRLDQVECILIEGWVVSVYVNNAIVEYTNYNDDALNKCVRDFEFSLRSAGQLADLTARKAEG